MRRGGIIQLVLIGLVAGAIAAAVAYFVPWLPTPATKEAVRIKNVYWITIIICLVIFAVVMAILIYAMITFRVKDGDLSDGPPVHGNTRIEIIWTIAPAIFVTAIAVVSAIALAQDSHAGRNPLRITAIGQQFAWTFKYPNGKLYPVMHLPKDRGVILTVTSDDVIHSFWVPQFDQKQDAVPGQVNTLVITPTKLGVFPVVCTELCGLGHALMRSEAIVMPPAAYNKWWAEQNAPPPPSGGGDAGAIATFNSSGCGACHVFTPIKTAIGKVGPSLDTLKADAAKAGQPLDDFISTSITDPDAYVAPTYAKGTMPATFGQSIPKSQLDALVQYLAQNTN